MVDLRVYSFADCPKEVFRFRYKIYVEELHRPQSYADHTARTIIDPMDATAHHGVAFDGDDIVAVIRLNFVRDGNTDPYFRFYEIDKLTPSDQAVATICTRNMIAPAHRGTSLSFRMLKLMYLLALEHGSAFCYIDVNEPLLPLFERIGCKPLFKKEHADYGLVTVMRLDGLDLDHFRAVRSPFAPVCAKFLKDRGLEPQTQQIPPQRHDPACITA